VTYYAVITEPSKEIAVRHTLKKAGETTFIPAFVKRQKAGKGKRKLIPIIPRLVFVRAPDEPETRSLWMYRIKQVRGVKEFFTLGKGMTPASTSDDKVARFKTQIASDVKAARVNTQAVRKGKAARIKSGAFTGSKGQVTFLKGNRAKVLGFFFGSTREIEIRADNLEAA
jgi:transcription antitermination factor NusG